MLGELGLGLWVGLKKMGWSVWGVLSAVHVVGFVVSAGVVSWGFPF